MREYTPRKITEPTGARTRYSNMMGNGFFHWRRWVQIELRMHRSEGNRYQRIVNRDYYYETSK